MDFQKKMFNIKIGGKLSRDFMKSIRLNVFFTGQKQQKSTDS